MESIKQQAEYYRMALGLGLVPVAEVIAWCDSVIETEPSPDIGIIHASLAGIEDVNAVDNALTRIEGTCDQPAVIRQIFGLMSIRLKQDRSQASRIARDLFYMAMDDEVPEPDIVSEMQNFWDTIDYEAEMEYLGISNNLEAQIDELLRFLEKHQMR